MVSKVWWTLYDAAADDDGDNDGDDKGNVNDDDSLIIIQLNFSVMCMAHSNKSPW